LLCRYLKLNKLREGFSNATKKINNRALNEEEKNHKDYGSSQFQPFEPKMGKGSQKIEPIQAVINPNYENIVRMLKTFTDAHVNLEYKIKELN
jgi:hypothetical protein